MFICGSGSFSQNDPDEHEAPAASPCSTPKRSKRTTSTSFCKLIGKDTVNKNRFADRGLDKFYALLADLDHRKQKIYTEMGAEEISMVRFVYTSDSDQARPIVIKSNKEKTPTFRKPIASSPAATTVASRAATAHDGILKEEATNEKPRRKRRNLRCKESFKMDSLRQPHRHLLLILVLVLVVLAIYGRSLAILCTSIGWYMVPTVVGGSSTADLPAERRPKRKKEDVRRQSAKKAVLGSEGPYSPKSVINGLVGIK